MSEITMDLRLVFKIPDSGLTINGLIQGLKEGCPQIHGAIISTLMKALEEQIIAKRLSEEPDRYRANGHQSKPRRLRSSLGTISYRFSQLIDRKENRTFAPLVEALCIPSYDHILEEATEGPMGLTIHVSYRRATQEIKRISGQSMSHTTLHTRLQRFAQGHCPFRGKNKTPFRFLIVDGTKVHLQGPGGQDLGQAEMRWALAAEHASGPFEPIGFWIDTQWAQIRKDLEERLDYSKIEVLFSDGGPGIEDNLLRSGMEHQRCLWHGKRDFPYLLYADGVKKEQQRPLVEKLHSIPLLHLTKSQLEGLCPEDRPQIEALVDQTQQGELIPLNANAIESAFSQVGNRTKKIGRRWSDQGLLNWLKIAFYKIFKPHGWGSLWLHQQKTISLKLNWCLSQPHTAGQEISRNF